MGLLDGSIIIGASYAQIEPHSSLDDITLAQGIPVDLGSYLLSIQRKLLLANADDSQPTPSIRNDNLEDF